MKRIGTKCFSICNAAPGFQTHVQCGYRSLPYQNGDLDGKTWMIGIERVLGSDAGVQVFAPQFPTERGKGFGQLEYLMTMSFDMKLCIRLKC